MSCSSMLGSQSLVLATTAMVVSSTVLFLAFSRHNKPDHPEDRPLRSCLCSDGKRSGQEKKKKRVKFAEGVTEPRMSGQEFRRSQRRNSIERKYRDRDCEVSTSSSSSSSSCSSEMPANRAALYSGILRDRAQRMECSY